jgi:membrane-associated phospholipid phosphatase
MSTIWPLKRSPFDIAKRVFMWLASGFAILVGYAWAKLEPFHTAELLPLTAIDEAIPLLPWTVWIYGSGSKMALLTWLCVPDSKAARRLFFSLTLSAMLCWVFFLAWPTTFPRDLWPLPPGDTATLVEFRDLREADSPSNCFPSQHVALAWALALCWVDWTRRRWVKVGIVAWAAAVTICTLTTKQHYIVDIPGGMLAGIGAWAVIRARVPGVRRPWAGLTVSRQRDQQVLGQLLARVRAHQWSLEDIPWPSKPLKPLPATMASLLNQIIYIEEIAGLNFQLLQKASHDPLLKELYGLFADEERRHADGLRRVLAHHGHGLEAPGLGAALVLNQFDDLDPDDEKDALLVAVSTPVFETFLDAGTIPFLKKHPALQGEAFDALVSRVDRDEAAHLAVNWIMTREAARRRPGRSGLGLLLNTQIYRGMIAVPFMSMDTYALAHRLGYRFETLFPAFKRLWRLHRRYPELAHFPLWLNYRLFVICGATATAVTAFLARHRLLMSGIWVVFVWCTTRLSAVLFGPGLLEKRGLQPLRQTPSPQSR